MDRVEFVRGGSMTTQAIILEVSCWILTLSSFIGTQLIIVSKKKQREIGLWIWLVTDILFVIFYTYQIVVLKSPFLAMDILSIFYTIQTIYGLFKFYKPKKRKRKKDGSNKTKSNELTKKLRQVKKLIITSNDFT